MLLRTPVECTGCGRTDTGVHASMFYAHFDGPENFPQSTPEFIYHLNAVLPRDIAIQQIIPVHESAHARFDAVSRRYEYHIVREKDPFAQHRAWELRDSLDFEMMNRAAAMIPAYSDFSCFEKTGGQNKTSICKLSRAEWIQSGSRWIFHVQADRFLRNMVRAIVGTLVDVGRGKKSLDDMKRILESGDRSEAGASVPAHGLYLAEIIYPESHGLTI